MEPPTIRDNLPIDSSDSSSSGSQQNSPARSEEPRRQEENLDDSDSNAEQRDEAPNLVEEEEEEEGPRGKALRFMPKSVKTSITNIVKHIIIGLLKASADNDNEAERLLTLGLIRAPELVSTKGGKPSSS